MEYNVLLDLTVELGYRLAMNGAETFRIEESIHRILMAYGIESEIFCIPNSLIVSLETSDGVSLTRLRRIGDHGNDLDAVERYNSLSRRICETKPDPHTALAWLKETDANKRSYDTPMLLLGNVLGAFGFCLLFGGTFIDGLCAGLCGLVVGLCNKFMSKLQTNPFFKTMASSYFMALLAYALNGIGACPSPDTAVIGALMLLVPGLLITNAMRDIIYGDTNSGVNRLVQVLLIAVAIALGTAAAWSTAANLWHAPVSAAPTSYNFLTLAIACFIGCTGFVFVFNIHGIGSLLCCLGAVIAYGAYYFALKFGCSDIISYFLGAVAASSYAEIMARIRKCPAIAYLVVSIVPLIPGAGVYYAMSHAVQGESALFATRGLHTAAIAGVMAVGILLVSTGVRLWNLWKLHFHKK